MKFTKILSMLAAGVALFSMGACTDEVSYEPAPKFEGDEVYFNVDEIGTINIPVNATSVSFHLYRFDATSDLSVGLVSTATDAKGEDASAIFSCPETVSFPAGTSEIEVPITIVFEAVKAETPYTFHVQIAGDKLTPYGATSADFTLLYATQWEEWSKMAGGDGWYQETLWGIYNESPVSVRHSTNMPHLTQYLFEGPFTDLLFDYVLTVDTSIPLNKNDNYMVPGFEGQDIYFAKLETIKLDDQIITLGGETAYLEDVTTWVDDYFKARGREYTDAQLAQLCIGNEFPLSVYVPSTGQFYIDAFAVNQGIKDSGTLSRYAGFSYYTFQLPGFLTYGVFASDGGYDVDATGLETKKFTISKTEDTPGMKYILKKETLDSVGVKAAVEEVLADEEAVVVTDAEATIGYELNEGTYTLVVVATNAEGVAIKDNDGEYYTATYVTDYKPTVNDGYTTIGYANFSDGFMNSIAEYETYTWSVEVQTNPELPGVYRLKNPYKQWALDNDCEDLIAKGNYYITLNASNSKCVYLEESNIGLRETVAEGYIHVYSIAGQMIADGAKDGQVIMKKVNGSLKNNIITFPAKSLLVAFESELPEWTEANVKSSFKLDLNTLTEGTDKIKAISVERGRKLVAPTAAKIEVRTANIR